MMGRSIRGELTSRSPVAGAGQGRSSVSDLLARILQNPSEAEEEAEEEQIRAHDRAESSVAGAETDKKAMEREVADAERVVLPCKCKGLQA